MTDAAVAQYQTDAIVNGTPPLPAEVYLAVPEDSTDADELYPNISVERVLMNDGEFHTVAVYKLAEFRRYRRVVEEEVR